MSALFRTPSTRQLDIALAVLRLAIGAVFIAHGGQKVFVYGIEGVVGSFGQMGMPMAGIVGPLVAFGELLGGIALVLGFLTRAAGAGLALIMAGALFLVHLPAGFFLPNGIEYVLVLFAAAVAFALTGAGAYSVDAIIARRTQPVRLGARSTAGARRAA
jgi:putative oxidoreductase